MEISIPIDICKLNIYKFLLNHFQIKPGHNNMISLSATKVDADPSIESIEPERRKCIFPHENQVSTSPTF